MEDLNKPPLYAIRPVPGRGDGVVAIQDIQKGTRIISESPLLTFPGDSLHPTSRNALLEKLEGLKREDRAMFYKLQNARPDLGKEIGIFKTNSFPTDSFFVANARNGHRGIFPTVGTLNHDCRSNAVWLFNGVLNRLTVHALRDIKLDEEITLDYIDKPLPRELRQQRLQFDFGFTCTCDLCSLPPDQQLESDRRLKSAGFLHEKIFKYPVFSATPRSFSRIARRLLQLLEEEGLSDAFAHSVYSEAFKRAALDGDVARSKGFAKRCSEHHALVAGDDSPTTVYFRVLAENPTVSGYFSRLESPRDDTPTHLTEEEYDCWLWKQWKNDPLSKTTELACFANHLPFSPCEWLPASNSDMFLIDKDTYNIRQHWCFFAEIELTLTSRHLEFIVRDAVGKLSVAAFENRDSTLEVLRQGPLRGMTLAILDAKKDLCDKGIRIPVHHATHVKVYTHERRQYQDTADLHHKVFPITIAKLSTLCGILEQFHGEMDGCRKCHACDRRRKNLLACAKCGVFWYCHKVCTDRVGSMAPDTDLISGLSNRRMEGKRPQRGLQTSSRF